MSNTPGFNPRRAAAMLGLATVCAALVYVFFFTR
jgi:hypothetical protein